MPDTPVQRLPWRLHLMALFIFSTARIIYDTTIVYGTLVISCTLKMSPLSWILLLSQLLSDSFERNRLATKSCSNTPTNFVVSVRPSRCSKRR